MRNGALARNKSFFQKLFGGRRAFLSGVWVARVVGVDTRVRGYDGWRDGAFLGVDWGARDDGWILEFEGVARGDLGGWKHLGRGLWFDRLTTNADKLTTNGFKLLTNGDKLTTNGAETVRQGEQGWGGRHQLPLARLMAVDAPLAPT